MIQRDMILGFAAGVVTGLALAYANAVGRECRERRIQDFNDKQALREHQVRMLLINKQSGLARQSMGRRFGFNP